MVQLKKFKQGDWAGLYISLLERSGSEALREASGAWRQRSSLAAGNPLADDRLHPLLVAPTELIHWRAVVGSPVWERTDALQAYHALRYAFQPAGTVWDPENLGGALLYSVATRRRERAKALLGLAVARLASGRIPFHFRKGRPDVAAGLTFAAWLAAAWMVESTLQVEVREPYSPLVEHWLQPSEESIRRVCDAHFSDAALQCGLPFGTMFEPIPIEFVAMNVVRRAQGLAEVSCAHPLFDNSIGKSFVERQTPRYEPKDDPLFVSVAEALIREGRTGELDPYVL